MREQKKYEAPEIEVTRFEVGIPIMDNYPQETEGDLWTEENSTTSVPELTNLPVDW